MSVGLNELTPVKTFRHGNLAAAIFRRPGRGQARPSFAVVVQRRCADSTREWENTRSFNQVELILALDLLQMARRYLERCVIREPAEVSLNNRKE